MRRCWARDGHQPLNRRNSSESTNPPVRPCLKFIVILGYKKIPWFPFNHGMLNLPPKSNLKSMSIREIDAEHVFPYLSHGSLPEFIRGLHFFGKTIFVVNGKCVF